MYGSFGATNASLTNNPFIPDSHPSNRYPDISTPQSQVMTWTDPTFSSGDQQQYIYQQYAQQQQQQIPPGYTQQQQPQQPQNYLSSYPQSQPQLPTSFQPNSSFGQNLQAAISGSSYGYLQQGQQPQAQQTGYNPAQDQLRNNPGYIAQFDPYGSISQGWGDTATNQTQPQSVSIPTSNNNSSIGYGNNQIIMPSGSAGFSSAGDPHPREYIRSHKQEIEAWDAYAWKQLLNTFEALKRAWETRRSELREKVTGLQAQLQYAGYYNQAQIQQEGGKIQGLLNEANSNFDSVAASTFQIEEVFKGYRQSGDLSSKRRVREATNAALQSLPNWPQPY